MNINLVSFSIYLQNLVGQIFTMFILTVAAAEAAVGLAIIALLSTMLLVLVDNYYSHLGVVNILRQFLDNIDFNRTLMEGMLCFLLFAGALHINLDDLLKSKLFWII